MSAHTPVGKPTTQHPNELLLERLFTALDQHDHATMVSCYHPTATFRDIAFDLRGSEQIHSMWRMICDGDIHTTFEIVHANDQEGHAKVVDRYTFDATLQPGATVKTGGRPVLNIIDSRLRFSDGKIIEHTDDCDARLWAKMALGGISGFLAGRMPWLRRRKARQKLADFVRRSSERP